MIPQTVAKRDAKYAFSLKPYQAQHRLTECLLRNDLEGAQQHLSDLSTICAPTNAHWRLKRAAKKVLNDVSGGFIAGPKECREVVNCVQQLLGKADTFKLLDRLGLGLVPR